MPFGRRKKPPRKRLLREIEFEEQQPLLRSFRPKLRSDVTTVPQTFRGRPFHVLQDPVSLQYFRIGEAEAKIIEKFDGQRTLSDIYDELKEQWGETAPGFNELAHFVFALRNANLLVADATDKYFLDRSREKKRARLVSTASNFLFVRIPLVDPDRFLEKTVRFVRWVFSVPFFLVWLATVGTACVLFAMNAREFWQPVNSVLGVENLPLLWVAFILVKFFHEFGHAYAAKTFGAEVHRMGILFLVFMPCLYVDVTPVWAFQRKWLKVLVGAGGMLTELFVASLAVFLFLALEPGEPLRAVAFNMVFIASVSTILFNANPLLRFDGYYILADTIEIANLRTRSTQYVLYLLQHHILGIEKDPPPLEESERSWLVTYGILASIYRVFIVFGIILFIAGQLFILGALIAIVTSVVWLVIPLGKGIRYLFWSPHTYATRARATAIVLALLVAVVVLVGFVPLRRRVAAPCVLEPREEVVVRPGWSGFLRELAVADGDDVAAGDLLAVLRNDELEYQVARVKSEIETSQARVAMLERQNLAALQAEAFKLEALRQKEQVLMDRRESLAITAPIAGRVVAADLEKLKGAYLNAGDPLLRIASLDAIELQVVLDENAIAEVARHERSKVKIRLRTHPDRDLAGTVTKIYSGATKEAPPEPLTDLAGGPVLLNPQAREGRQTLLPWFRVDVELEEPPADFMLGATGTVKFTIESEPLAGQFRWWLARLLAKRFLM